MGSMDRNHEDFSGVMQMAWWLTIYCTEPVSHLTGSQLLEGMCGLLSEMNSDARSQAGEEVKARAKAQEQSAEHREIAQALANVRVLPYGKLPLETALHYAVAEDRPVFIHCWRGAERIEEELEECRSIRNPPPGAAVTLDACVEIVALELGYSQLSDDGIVLAAQASLYLAQQGKGIVVDDDNEWFSVNRSGFGPLK